MAKSCIGYFVGEGDYVFNVIPKADYYLRIYHDPIINRFELINIINGQIKVISDIKLANADYKTFWKTLRIILKNHEIRKISLYNEIGLVDQELLNQFNKTIYTEIYNEDSFVQNEHIDVLNFNVKINYDEKIKVSELSALLEDISSSMGILYYINGKTKKEGKNNIFINKIQEGCIDISLIAGILGIVGSSITIISSLLNILKMFVNKNKNKYDNILISEMINNNTININISNNQ